jgi:hypothetical protein
MARGDFTLFNDFAEKLGNGEHDLNDDTFKLMIISTVTEPVATEAAPAFSTYSSGQVGEFVGGYVTGGVDINAVYAEVTGTGTLTGDDIALTQNASGFDDAYWGILYNDTNASKFAVGWIEFAGAVSQIDGPVNLNWNVSGILTVAV